MTAGPMSAEPTPAEPTPVSRTPEPTGEPTGEPAAPRWVWPAIVGVSLVWAAGLGTLAATRANEPTLNRVQFRRADAVVLLEVTGRTARGVRATVREAVPGGRGPVPAELRAGATITVAPFPDGAAAAGTVTAAPVRRVGRGWEVAEAPAGLPRLVYPGDWSGLKAAAAALSAGRDPYR